MQPSDSPAPVGRGSGSPCQRPTSMRTLFLTACAWSAYALGVGEGSPVSPSTRVTRGKARVSQVAGPSSSCVPWSKTPPGAVFSSPLHGEATVAFRSDNTLGTRNKHIFEATAHGPHVRLPTHQPSRCRDDCKAGYRPGRAHPWPGGIRTRWTTDEVSWTHRILHSPSTSLARSLLSVCVTVGEPSGTHIDKRAEWLTAPLSQTPKLPINWLPPKRVGAPRLRRRIPQPW